MQEELGNTVSAQPVGNTAKTSSRSRGASHRKKARSLRHSNAKDAAQRKLKVGRVTARWTPEDENHLIKHLATVNSTAITQGKLLSINSACEQLTESTEPWATKRTGVAWARQYRRRQDTLDRGIRAYSSKHFNIPWRPSYAKPNAEKGLSHLRGLFCGHVRPFRKEKVKHPRKELVHTRAYRSESEQSTETDPQVRRPRKTNSKWTPQDQYRFVKYLATQNSKAIAEKKLITIRGICGELEKSRDMYQWASKRSGEGWYNQYFRRRVQLDREIDKFSTKYFKSRWRPDYSCPDHDKNLLPLRGAYYGPIHSFFRQIGRNKVVAGTPPPLSGTGSPERNDSVKIPHDFQQPLHDVSDQNIVSSLSTADVGNICQEGIKSTQANQTILQSGFKSIVRKISGRSGFKPNYVKDIWLLAGDLSKAEAFLAQRKPEDVDT